MVFHLFLFSFFLNLVISLQVARGLYLRFQWKTCFLVFLTIDIDLPFRTC